MKLIADANILFSLVRHGSVTQQLVKDHNIQLYSVDYVLAELENHKKTLLQKSNLATFAKVTELLQEYVQFHEAAKLQKELKQVKKVVSDEQDWIYFALAKKLHFVIWTNDKHFKQQEEFEILTTKKLIELLY